MSAQTRQPADVLGIPFLPPGAATTAMTRVRASLGRIHAAMAPPPVGILEGLFGMLDHRVLVAICEAGIPDVLDRPLGMAALAERTGCDPERLERLARYASTRGWLKIDRRGRVRPTRTTAFLRRDHPGGWRAWVDFAGGGDVVRAVGALTAEAGDGPFTAANGAAFFEWMAEHPDRWAAFDAAMAAGGRLHGLGLAAAVEWTASRRVCDVGGGTGHLLLTLLDRCDHLEGAVYDLPAVVERAVEHPRLTTIGGDMFASVPGGFDTYLLVNVVHDWGDDDVRRILRAITTAAPGARVLVVESERTTVPRADIATATDVLMAALTGAGRERTEEHLVALARDAGLTRSTTTRLASGDLALELRA
jgi:hypothetical protein